MKLIPKFIVHCPTYCALTDTALPRHCHQDVFSASSFSCILCRPHSNFRTELYCCRHRDILQFNVRAVGDPTFGNLPPNNDAAETSITNTRWSPTPYQCGYAIPSPTVRPFNPKIVVMGLFPRKCEFGALAHMPMACSSRQHRCLIYIYMTGV